MIVTYLLKHWEIAKEIFLVYQMYVRYVKGPTHSVTHCSYDQLTFRIGQGQI